MEIISIISLIAVFVIGVGSVLAMEYAKNYVDETIAVTALLAYLVLVAIFIISVTYNEPTALDVYQGKTTLRITYDNNVPVDTVVIYKK